MTPRVLVTGSTGQIGRALVQDLLRDAAGMHIVAASRQGAPGSGVEARSLDWLDPASAAAALRGIDRLFLLTPLNPAIETMTAHAVAAARDAGVAHIVRISGAGADPDSAVSIARLQGRCDRLLVESGIAFTLLRPVNFMQNFASFMREGVRSGTVYSSQGEGRVPFVDARDIAAAAAAILRAPQPHAGRAYVLTGPEALSNAEALAIVGEAIGRPVRLVPVDESQAVAGMRQAGMPEPMVQAMSSLNRVIAAGGASGVWPDLQRLIGRAPTRFAAFVHEYRDRWL